MAPSAERYSELKDLNEALNRRLKDLQVQITTSRDKLKKVKQNLQTEKEETMRLHLAVERQRNAKKEVVTERNDMQAKLDAKDKEVSYSNPFSPPSSFHF